MEMARSKHKPFFLNRGLLKDAYNKLMKDATTYATACNERCVCCARKDQNASGATTNLRPRNAPAVPAMVSHAMQQHSNNQDRLKEIEMTLEIGSATERRYNLIVRHGRTP